MKRDRHYSIEEKTNIIAKELGPGPEEYIKPCARKIAEATECFTFLMLDDLVKALRLIAKGND